jgi:hypothetical protein
MLRVIIMTLLQCTAIFFGADSVSGQTATPHKSPHTVLKRSCEDCHVPTSFNHIRFDHDKTGFTLSKRHSEVTCLACHNVEDFSKVESQCVTCHQDIHRNRLGVACDRCHTEEGWTVFDPLGIHENTSFPIQAKHIWIDCLACHPGMPTADFRRAWTPCYDCHRQDYEATTNPDHRASGFTVLCQVCHEMTRWTPAIMPDHDVFFPIYSGKHNRKWDTCTDCHVVPGNYKVFECTLCHEHLQPEMDSKHQGIPGYIFSSPACYQCHPTGEAGDFGDHDVVFFPVFSGPHNNEWNSCTDCHPNPLNKKEFTCVSCHEHDRARMDDKHLGEVDDYVYSSAACYDCHPNGLKEDN